MRPFEPKDLKKLKTYTLSQRHSLANRKDMGNPIKSTTCSLNDFFNSLPQFMMATDLLKVAQHMQLVKASGKCIHVSVGSHVIKNGLSRYLVDWMKRGFIQTISFNGSALIHDFELAYVGHTSENVDAGIDTGAFGVPEETNVFIHQAILDGKGVGLGAAVGKAILAKAQFAEDSVLAQAYALKVPATVHVAIGTDVIHLHPNFSPEITAQESLIDFHHFVRSISMLEDGMYFNIGSAVILPEVFLKAVTLVRNLGYSLENFWAVNLDFIRQYRPRRNVLERPTQKGGKAIELIGPHELLIPLLHAASLHKFSKPERVSKV